MRWRSLLLPYTPARRQPEGWGRSPRSCAWGRAVLGGKVLRGHAGCRPALMAALPSGQGRWGARARRMGQRVDLCLSEMLSFPFHRQLGQFPSFIANIGVRDPLRQVCCEGRRFLPWKEVSALGCLLSASICVARGQSCCCCCRAHVCSAAELATCWQRRSVSIPTETSLPLARCLI